MSGTIHGWCAEWYEAKAAGLILYGRALGLSHAEAEDVVHDTFAALLALERRPECVEHYVLRAFRNRALNYRRGFWRRVRRELESVRWFEPGSAADPRERLAMRRLQGLPAPQREVIVLKIWHGHTFEEIGRLIGVSPHTVAGRYRYGMEKIRRALEGVCDANHESVGESLGWLDPAPPVDPA